MTTNPRSRNSFDPLTSGAAEPAARRHTPRWCRTSSIVRSIAVTVSKLSGVIIASGMRSLSESDEAHEPIKPSNL